MECTICKDLGRVVLKLFTTVKYFFHKDFIKENYYKHFGLTICIIFLLFIPLSFLESFRETQIVFKILFGGILGCAINWWREDTLQAKYNAPFSEEDVIFGTYGGILGGAIIDLGLTFLNLK